MNKNFAQEKTTIKRIVLLGPECSGKTTLAKKLANYYQETFWVPEFARLYAENKLHIKGSQLDVSDVLDIAQGQITLENIFARSVKKILICDTNLIMTKIYAEIYYGYSNDLLDKYALKNKYNKYILLYPDIDWVDDTIRQRYHSRIEDFAYCIDTLIKLKKDFVILYGNYLCRFHSAIYEINKIFEFE